MRDHPGIRVVVLWPEDERVVEVEEPVLPEGGTGPEETAEAGARRGPTGRVGTAAPLEEGRLGGPLAASRFAATSAEDPATWGKEGRSS